VFCCFASFIFPSSLILPQVCLLNLKTKAISFWFVNILYCFSHSTCNWFGSLSLLPFPSYFFWLFYCTFSNFLIWICIISSFVFSLSCFLIHMLQAMNFPLRLVSHRCKVPIFIVFQVFHKFPSASQGLFRIFFPLIDLWDFKKPIFLLSRSNFTAWWSENMVCMILIWREWICTFFVA